MKIASSMTADEYNLIAVEHSLIGEASDGVMTYGRVEQPPVGTQLLLPEIGETKPVGDFFYERTADGWVLDPENSGVAITWDSVMLTIAQYPLRVVRWGSE